LTIPVQVCVPLKHSIDDPMSSEPSLLSTETFQQSNSGDWHRSLAAAVRDPDELLNLLRLPDEFREPARRAAEQFPLLVPRSYLSRIEPGNPRDPLLLQILPLGAEQVPVAGFENDPVGDASARHAPGLLCKYRGRALLIATGACAVHCRYCFRRHYPYAEEPRRIEDWNPALAALSADRTLREVILSGGDPLMLTDERLCVLIDRLEDVSHLRRLRIHTRLPIVLPNRVTATLTQRLTGSRLTSIVVVHANHPREIAGDCTTALTSLVQSGITVLNQSVLLRGINDTADVLEELSERLIALGVMPYYLHQLDRVTGAAHFDVPQAKGRQLIEELRKRLPGYAVPRYVQEIPGREHKISLA